MTTPSERAAQQKDELKEWAARFPLASRGWLAACSHCGKVFDRRYDDHRMHWFVVPPRLGGYMLMEHFCVPCSRLDTYEKVDFREPHLLPRPSEPDGHSL